MCESAKSVDDCVQKTTSGRCAEGQTKCGKFSTELIMQGKKVRLYRKACQTEMTCKKENDLYGQACGSDDTCEFHCCEGDLCNAGSLLLPALCPSSHALCCLFFTSRTVLYGNTNGYVPAARHLQAIIVKNNLA